MFIKSEVTLIYEGQGVAEDGSPVLLSIEKPRVRCDEMETFSNRYYNEQERNMRMSRNLVIPTYLTHDIYEEGVRYELLYCIYDDLKYKVKNILKYRTNKFDKGYTRNKMVLDIQELRWKEYLHRKRYMTF